MEGADVLFKFSICEQRRRPEVRSFWPLNRTNDRLRIGNSIISIQIILFNRSTQIINELLIFSFDVDGIRRVLESDG